MIPVRHMATMGAAAFIVAALLAAGVALRRAGEPPAAVANASSAYSLIDQNGQRVTEATFRGRWVLVFFGFTHCPDVCPTSMTYAADLMEALGPDAAKLQVAFVTVDPERDTPAALKDYLSNFSPHIVGLTGTPAEVAAAAKTFNVFYAKRALEGVNDYAIDHSTAFYMVDPETRLLRAFALQRGADEMTADLREAMSLAAAKTSNAGDVPKDMVISDVWMRASLGQVPTTTAYLKIENRGAADDKLLAVSTPAAAMAHIHESASANGVMTMAAVSALTIKTGQTVELAPGALHIMVMNLKAPLKAGETVPLTLKFERAGEIVVQAEVRGLNKP